MSSPRPQLPVLLSLAVAVSLAGCGKDPPTQPSATAAQQDADDATQQVAFLMAQDNGTSPESQATPGQSMTASRGTAPMSAQGVASTDTTFTIGSVTWTITRSFFMFSCTHPFISFFFFLFGGEIRWRNHHHDTKAKAQHVRW